MRLPWFGFLLLLFLEGCHCSHPAVRSFGPPKETGSPIGNSGNGKAVCSLLTSTSPGYSDILHGNSLPRVGSNLPLHRTSSPTIILNNGVDCKSCTKISSNFRHKTYVDFSLRFLCKMNKKALPPLFLGAFSCFLVGRGGSFTICSQIGGTIKLSPI